MKSDIVFTKSADETKKFAAEFAQKLNGGDILCLYGDLGSGKTTFVQGVSKGLRITKRILSPTFIIVRRFNAKVKNSSQNLNFFYHVDLYRTKSLHDLLGVGLEEILSDKKSIVCVEWAEKLLNLKPKKRIEIRFKTLGEDKRQLEIKKYE